MSTDQLKQYSQENVFSLNKNWLEKEKMKEHKHKYVLINCQFFMLEVKIATCIETNILIKYNNKNIKI